jgi:hypothetical protein
MSWLFSQALVEEYLGASSLDGEQSAPLNGNPTQQAYCAPDKMTDFSRLSRFGMTFKPLTESRGEELLTLFREDFLARTSALQEMVTDLMENDQECGEKWHGLLARFDPNMHLWRTVQCSLLEDLNESLQTLPQWGMTVNGELYLLPTLVQTTKEEEFGLWRTPDTGAGGTSGLLKKGKSHRANGQPIQIRLVDQVNNPHLWPTPTVCGNYNRKGLSKTSGDGLATAVMKFPTPQASDHRDRGNMSNPSIQRRVTIGKQIMLSQSVDPNSGQLNPTWVEWLMGWPLGWTDLKPLEMDKSHYVQQQHGES